MKSQGIIVERAVIRKFMVSVVKYEKTQCNSNKPDSRLCIYIVSNVRNAYKYLNKKNEKSKMVLSRRICNEYKLLYNLSHILTRNINVF